ncbi:MAG: hypothetical protein R3B93_22505 [Bacteroidia bacterium]
MLQYNAHQTPILKAWFFSDLKGVRELKEFSTYNHFDFDQLLKIDPNLSDDFSWLKPRLRYDSLRNEDLRVLEDRK